jgi:hypothetical protein
LPLEIRIHLDELRVQRIEAGMRLLDARLAETTYTKRVREQLGRWTITDVEVSDVDDHGSEE